MAQHDVELILTRQLASCLSVPIVLMGPTGDIIFYNEPAEALMGVRFQETGPIKGGDTEGRVRLTDERGHEIPRDQRPSGIALRERRPAHSQMWLMSATGGRRQLEVTAFPLLAQGGGLVGAAVMFWEHASP
jgi:PAS domain-containing protein